MKARGKRAARRPWFRQSAPSGLKGRNRCSITPFQGWVSLIRVPGATRYALAPGFHIPRLRRWGYLYARLLRQSRTKEKCMGRFMVFCGVLVLSGAAALGQTVAQECTELKTR